MKRFRVATALALFLISGLALAESGGKKTFETLKSLDGTWEGKSGRGEPLTVTFRETAGGSALLSEIHGMGKENMVSMIHLDGDRILLTHYCGAGNQPRMQGTIAADGKSVAFDFVDATNLSSPDAPHMHHLVISMPDANHHTEQWTFLDHGKEMTETLSMQRSK